jgi:hypothetical protein
MLIEEEYVGGAVEADLIAEVNPFPKANYRVYIQIAVADIIHNNRLSHRDSKQERPEHTCSLIQYDVTRD